MRFCRVYAVEDFRYLGPPVVVEYFYMGDLCLPQKATQRVPSCRALLQLGWPCGCCGCSPIFFITVDVIFPIKVVSFGFASFSLIASSVSASVKFGISSSTKASVIQMSKPGDTPLVFALHTLTISPTLLVTISNIDGCCGGVVGQLGFLAQAVVQFLSGYGSCVLQYTQSPTLHRVFPSLVLKLSLNKKYNPTATTIKTKT